ncbi:MAG: hypothetical protein WCC17_12090 [Candidatus Nitrosopolaris sp.]
MSPFFDPRYNQWRCCLHAKEVDGVLYCENDEYPFVPGAPTGAKRRTNEIEPLKIGSKFPSTKDSPLVGRPSHRLTIV